jgi:hypothetical protein
MSEITALTYTLDQLASLLSCFEASPLWWSYVSRVVSLQNPAQISVPAVIEWNTYRDLFKAGGVVVEVDEKILQQLPKWGSTLP